MCELWRIFKSRTTPYHPQGNGCCERLNQTIVGHLRKLLSSEAKTRWAEFLPAAVYAYNTTVHRSTGYTPHFLTYGVEARCPSEVIVGLPADATVDSVAAEQYRQLGSAMAEARRTLEGQQKRQKDWYDNGSTARLFRTGDRVRVRLSSLAYRPGKKLLPAWSRPYRVLEVRGVDVVIQQGKNRPLTLHSDKVTKITPQPEEASSDIEEISSDSDPPTADDEGRREEDRTDEERSGQNRVLTGSQQAEASGQNRVLTEGQQAGRSGQNRILTGSRQRETSGQKRVLTGVPTEDQDAGDSSARDVSVSTSRARAHTPQPLGPAEPLRRSARNRRPVNEPGIVYYDARVRL